MFEHHGKFGKKASRRRDGFTLMEMLVACTISGALMIVLLQWIASQHEASFALRQEEAALASCANTAQWLRTVSWESLPEEGPVAPDRLPELLPPVLAEGELSVAIRPAESGSPSLACREMIVRLSWPAGPERPPREVTVRRFRYHRLAKPTSEGENESDEAESPETPSSEKEGEA
jgi:prepilin-type N-terminal cleavage/methylation domain-containing protein